MKKLYSFIRAGLVGAVLLLATRQAQAGTSLVKTATAASGTGDSATATFSSATTAGNLLVVAIWYDTTVQPTPTISDNSSGGANTYTDVGEWHYSANGGYNGSQIFYAKNIKGGNTTVTVTGPSGTHPSFCVYEISGADITAPLDQHSSADNESGAVSVSITPSAGAYVIAVGTASSPANGFSSPFTNDYHVVGQNLGGGEGGACAHLLSTNGTSATPFITSAGTINGSEAVIASFKMYSATNTLTSSQNPSLYGGAVTFAAALTGGVGTPTGTVTFKNGTNILGAGTLNASGVAYFGTSTLAVGTNVISAVYGGDGNYSAGATGALVQTNTGPVAVTINNPSFESQTVSDGTSTTTIISWTVYNNNSASYGIMNPINNNTVINNATVDGNNVAYMQNANPGTAIIYQDIGNVSQSGNYTLALLVGNRKDLTTGTPAITLATGSSFGTGGSGLTPLTPKSTTTPALVNDAGNMVQWTMSYSVSASTHVWIELADSGINNWVAFDNVQLYGGNPSTNTLTSSQNPSLAGGGVTFTATVTGSGGTPTGTVVFMDGTNTLGNGTLNASGLANFSTAALSLGAHSITALYGGDSTFGGSASSTLS